MFDPSKDDDLLLLLYDTLALDSPDGIVLGLDFVGGFRRAIGEYIPISKVAPFWNRVMDLKGTPERKVGNRG